MRYPPEYYEGLRLFNAGHYWHAHEQWEACWLVADGDDRQFYKAIIQAAAALVKWQQGNLRGLALNWAKSRSHLASLPAVYGGVDLAALVEDLDRLAGGATTVPPQLVVVEPAESGF
jgi:hypothetical protein